METRRLEYFLHIADAGSISKAAHNLGIAQPALSRQLAILETELKSALFERSASGIRLTDAGRTLYARAQIIVRQVSSLRLDVTSDARGLSGLVAFGMPPSHEQFIGISLVAEALTRHPNLRLQIHSGGTMLALLHAGTVDLALVPGEVSDGTIEATPLFREELLLIQRAGAGVPPADLGTLATLPWIVTRAQSAVHGILAAIFAQSAVRPRIVAEMSSQALILHAVQRGLGVTVLPRAAVVQALARGEVTAWPIGEPPPSRMISLCQRRNPSSSPSVAAIAQLMHELAARELARTSQSAPVLLPPV